MSSAVQQINLETGLTKITRHFLNKTSPERAGTVLLALLPNIDRTIKLNSVRQFLAVGPILVLLAAIVNLVIVGGRFFTQIEPTVSYRTPNIKLAVCSDALIEQGRVLFRRKGCVACHSVGGKDGEIVPKHDGTGDKYSMGRLKEILSTPKILNPNTAVPYFEGGNEGLEALAASLKSLGAGKAVETTGVRRIKDDLGRVVIVPYRVKRIVSLAPSATENLFAIGAGTLVVGVTSACDYPPQVKKLPQVGDFMKPSLERVAALKPDLIIIVSSTIPKAIADDLQEKTKVPVFVFQPRTVEDILRGLKVLGELANRRKQAQNLVNLLEKRLKVVAKRVANRKKVSVVVEISPPPSLMVVGPGNFIDDAIRLAGGKNAFNDAPQPFPIVSLESLAVKNPDVYLVAVKGKTRAQLLNEIRKRPGFSNLRCVQNRRVYGIDPDLIFRPTPRLISGIEEMAQLLHSRSSVKGVSLNSGRNEADIGAQGSNESGDEFRCIFQVVQRHHFNGRVHVSVGDANQTSCHSRTAYLNCIGIRSRWTRCSGELVGNIFLLRRFHQ